MMPQREANESTHEQAGPTYGSYEGDQVQHDQTFYEPLLKAGPVGKVYAEPSDNKNILRLIAMAMAMVTLIAFGFLCLVFVGGTGGWISFCAACLAIFLVTGITIDKIK